MDQQRRLPWRHCWLSAAMHESARVEQGAVIFPGASCAAGVGISAHARVGEGSVIGKGAIIKHCAEVGSDVRVGAGAIVGPYARVRTHVTIGSNVKIPPYATIAVGATILSGDWFVTVGPIGESERIITAVHSYARGLLWWSGCKRGLNTEQFIEQFQRCSDYEDFAAAIEFIQTHPRVKERELERVALR